MPLCYFYKSISIDYGTQPNVWQRNYYEHIIRNAGFYSRNFGGKASYPIASTA